MPDLSRGFDHAGSRREITSPLQNPEVIKKAALRPRVLAAKRLPVLPARSPVPPCPAEEPLEEFGREASAPAPFPLTEEGSSCIARGEGMHGELQKQAEPQKHGLQLARN